MKQSDRTLKHAKAAVDRTVASISFVRARLQAEDTDMTMQQRLIGRDVLHDLERRHGLLAELYADMVTSTSGDLAERWRNFFCGYDDFLDAARRAKADLVREEVHPCFASQLKRDANA